MTGNTFDQLFLLLPTIDDDDFYNIQDDSETSQITDDGDDLQNNASNNTSLFRAGTSIYSIKIGKKSSYEEFLVTILKGQKKVVLMKISLKIPNDVQMLTAKTKILALFLFNRVKKNFSQWAQESLCKKIYFPIKNYLIYFFFVSIDASRSNFFFLL